MEGDEAKTRTRMCGNRSVSKSGRGPASASLSKCRFLRKSKKSGIMKSRSTAPLVQDFITHISIVLIVVWRRLLVIGRTAFVSTQGCRCLLLSLLLLSHLQMERGCYQKYRAHLWGRERFWGDIYYVLSFFICRIVSVVLSLPGSFPSLLCTPGQKEAVRWRLFGATRAHAGTAIGGCICREAEGPGTRLCVSFGLCVCFYCDWLVCSPVWDCDVLFCLLTLSYLTLAWFSRVLVHHRFYKTVWMYDRREYLSCFSQKFCIQTIRDAVCNLLWLRGNVLLLPNQNHRKIPSLLWAFGPPISFQVKR